ncbi:unnamed protein product [Notodromas monacha]|uniref:Glycosyltransferase family 92 protein n=1 Tax=Notodromas monacha TaxID=399045 RepID=A0A7R9BEN5_9CRUS|nr:unnamed protein product [Notodromas monacha]CAG0912400.1 unnamed protein product [Notodromas monacha]
MGRCFGCKKRSSTIVTFVIGTFAVISLLYSISNQRKLELNSVIGIEKRGEESHLQDTEPFDAEFIKNSENGEFTGKRSNPSTSVESQRNPISKVYRHEESFNISMQQLYTRLEQEVYNIPIKYWKTVESKLSKMNLRPGCAQMPNIFELSFDNSLWQLFEATNATFYIYSAHLDNRALVPNATIRILSMTHVLNPRQNAFCQLWYEGTTNPVIVPVMNYNHMWGSRLGTSQKLQPYMIECQLPLLDGSQAAPVAVSVVEQECDIALNLIKVVYNPREPRKNQTLAVCVKRFHHVHDEPVFNMIEYLELVRILGAEKVYIYILEPQPNPKIERIIKYYEVQGFLEVSRITIPGKRPNSPILRHLYLDHYRHLEWILELIPADDCLLKNLHRHDLLAMTDFDEGQSEWNPEIPERMTWLNNVKRFVQISKPGTLLKTFMNTSDVLKAHSHAALDCVGNKCHVCHVPVTIGVSHHYKSVGDGQMKMQPDPKNFSTVEDLRLWHFKEELIPRYQQAVSDLGFDLL